jgi:hypothetical protein
MWIAVKLRLRPMPGTGTGDFLGQVRKDLDSLKD